ncbi:MAG: hypothetical protein WC718_16130 [Phycisphaerales bacterium]|jgi:hypothetical protein
MGLTYHFSFTAPADVPAARLEAFLQDIEGDARLMGFNPTTVVNGPFDEPGRREFARRVARGLHVEDPRLRGADLPDGVFWSFSREAGGGRLAPDHGVLLVVTDERARESVFGFFRYPQVIRDRTGREVMSVPGGGAWTSGDCVKSADPRYRSIVRRFAAAGYVASELDEFAPAPQR